ncbi:MAG TPA: hypothetical protein PKA90_01705 [Ignavibacteria bacterium]|nr:hypothetical protein [Ignavibacteria bacterium]HMR39122.1 hypothetical protein [Ignavibacteria bacterium]
MINAVRVANIEKDLEWKEFLRNQYNLFFDFNFNSYNDLFDKNINWHHLKFRESETNKILAVMIGCEKYSDGINSFVSCDGVSNGGFLWKKNTDLLNYFEIIKSFKLYLRENNFSHCLLKNPPFLYNFDRNEETEYALLKSGFKANSISITNIIDLKEFEFKKISGPKKRSINKSDKNIKVEIINDKLDEKEFRNYYSILFENRKLKNVTPTHTCEELFYLINKLNKDIIFFVAYTDSIPAAICVLFRINREIILNFYLAGDEKFKMKRVSEILLFKSIEWSKENGYKYYDIGTSDANGVLIEGLFGFKKKFLADGFLRKTFEINLLI